MIRRYPCQIVILFILGILTAKGAAMRQEVSPEDSGLLTAAAIPKDFGLSTAAAILADFGFLIAAAAVITAVALAVIWIRREPVGRVRLRQAVVLLLGFGIGAARMDTVSDVMEQQLANLTDNEQVSVQGRIIKKQFKEIQWAVCLTDSYLKTPHGIQSCGTVVIYLNTDEPVIGNTIIVSGKIKLFSQARNEGNFDERAYNQNQGYTCKVYADDTSYRVVEAHADGLQEFLYALQQNFKQIYENAMPDEEAGALSAMLLGEKSLLLDETKELYRQSGIAHILAISGLHISILGMAVYRLLRKKGISFVSAGAVSMGLLVLFAFMAGMGISTIRAAMMFSIYLGAACCGRAYDSVNGLAVAAMFLLFCNPRVLYLASFQFSFAAVAGVLFGKELCTIFRPKLKLTETVLMSFGIQLLTLPLTAWYYYEIPVYSILLNMLVLPCMELVLVTGLFGGSLGLLAGGAAACAVPGMPAVSWVCGMLSEGMLDICTMLLRYFSRAGNFFLQLPGAVCVTGQPQIWKMAGYFLILGVCVWRLAKTK